jgi:hypothetical protein
MAELSNSKRAVFPLGKQRAFLERVEKVLSVAEIARTSHCSERTVRDWRREKFSMPLVAVQTLATKANKPIPKNIPTRDAYAHTAEAGKKGAAVIMKKYGRVPGDENRRKEQWRVWWESKGKFVRNPILESKPIHRPRRGVELAEFVGIMMGDGGISKYQIAVTLHHIDDLEYASFVANLIKRLFKITPSIYHSPQHSVNDIVVSRKELVEYLHELGLPIGNKVKQQFDIPEWIKNDHKFSIACLRGLVDTDGSVFTHRYRVKGKQYAYKKLSFSSASTPLLRSVHTILRKLGLHSKLRARDVRLESITDMERYFSIISSHNPKHLRRYGSEVE